MKYVALSRGKHAIVDDVDYGFVTQWRWYCSPSNYAVREVHVAGSGQKNRKRYTVFMHRLLAGEPSGLEVDHINHNKLDNRKRNLRVCTHAENVQNSIKHKDNRSGYVGVFWNTQKGKYQAKIMRNGTTKHLGFFIYAKDASKAREEEYARLQKIRQEGPDSSWLSV